MMTSDDLERKSEALTENPAWQRFNEKYQLQDECEELKRLAAQARKAVHN